MSFLDDLHAGSVKPPEEEKPGIVGRGINSFVVGANKYVGLPIAGMTQMLGDATGIETLGNLGKTMAENTDSYLAEREKYDPAQKFQEINGVGDAAKWAFQQTAEMAPQMVLGAITGGAGAALGRGVVAGALERTAATAGIDAAETLGARIAGKQMAAVTAESIAEKAAAEGITEEASRQALTRLAAAQRASNVGMAVGGGASSVPMESTMIYQGQKDDEKSVTRALGYGFLAAVPDMGIMGTIAARTGITHALPFAGAFGEEAASLAEQKGLSIAKRSADVLKTIGITTGEGVSTEALQTVIERIGSNEKNLSEEARKNGFWKTAQEKGLSAAVDPAAMNDIIESAAAGGWMGGFMGGGGHAIAHLGTHISKDGVVVPDTAPAPTLGDQMAHNPDGTIQNTGALSTALAAAADVPVSDLAPAADPTEAAKQAADIQDHADATPDIANKVSTMAAALAQSQATAEKTIADSNAKIAELKATTAEPGQGAAKKAAIAAERAKIVSAQEDVKVAAHKQLIAVRDLAAHQAELPTLGTNPTADMYSGQTPVAPEQAAPAVQATAGTNVSTLLGELQSAPAAVAHTEALKQIVDASGDPVWKAATADGTIAGLGNLRVDSKGNVVLTRFAQDESGLTKDGKTATQEEMKSYLENQGGFAGNTVPTSMLDSWGDSGTGYGGVKGTITIPLSKLVQYIKEGKAGLASIGNGELVLSGDIAQKHLTHIDGKEVATKPTETHAPTVLGGLVSDARKNRGTSTMPANSGIAPVSKIAEPLNIVSDDKVKQEPARTVLGGLVDDARKNRGASTMPANGGMAPAVAPVAKVVVKPEVAADTTEAATAPGKFGIFSSNNKFSKDALSGKRIEFDTLVEAQQYAKSANSNNISAEKRTRYEARPITPAVPAPVALDTKTNTGHTSGEIKKVEPVVEKTKPAHEMSYKEWMAQWTALNAKAIHAETMLADLPHDIKKLGDGYSAEKGKRTTALADAKAAAAAVRPMLHQGLVEKAIKDGLIDSHADYPAAKSTAPAPVTASDELASMSADDIAAMIADVQAERGDNEDSTPRQQKAATAKVVDAITGGAAATSTEPKPSAMKPIKSAIEGVDELMKGIAAAFGLDASGSTPQSFPSHLNAESYAKAKPHMMAAWDKFNEAGKSLKEYIRYLLDNFSKLIPNFSEYAGYFMGELNGSENFDAEMAARAAVEEPELVETDEQPAAVEPAAIEPDTKTNTGHTEGKKRRTKEEVAARKEEADKLKEDRATAKKLKEDAKADLAKTNFQDIGQVWDPYSAREEINKAASTGVVEKDVKKIINKVAKPVLFDYERTDLTPGAMRLTRDVQAAVRTFQDYYIEQVARIKYDSGPMLEKISRFTGAYPERMEAFKAHAADYMADISQLTGLLTAYNNVNGISAAITSYYMNNEFFGLTVEDRAALNSRQTGEYLNEAGLKLGVFFTDGYRGLAKFLNNLGSEYVERENEMIAGDRDWKKRKKLTVHERFGMKDYAKAANIKSTDDFNKPFNFKAVAFGDYVPQAERPAIMDRAFNALSEIASIIGSPTQAISLAGETQMHFGNLGTANSHAAGLYFPMSRALNLARNIGDGSLAHEWAHSFDFVSRADFPSMKETIEDLKTAFQTVYDFDAAKALILEALDPHTSQKFKDSYRYKGVKGIELAKKVLNDQWNETVKKKSIFFKESKETGSGGFGAEYQTDIDEMFARAFEAYLADSLIAKKATDNYLVATEALDGVVTKTNGYSKMIYPTGEERVTFMGYFREFWNSLEWDADGRASLKPGTETTTSRLAREEEVKKQELLDSIEAMYKALFEGEPSLDAKYGKLWVYRYDISERGMGEQPKGYVGYDDAFKGDDQEGTGVVAYKDSLLAEDVVSFNLRPLVYTEGSLSYVGGLDGTTDELRTDGEAILEGVPAENVRKPGEEGDAENGTDPQSDDGEGGTGGSGAFGGTIRTSDGAGTEELDPAAGGTDAANTRPDDIPGSNYRIKDFADIGKRSVEVRFKHNLAAIRVLKEVEARGTRAADLEKDILVRYSGWGGLGEVFKSNPSENWAKRSTAARDMLTEEELDSGMRSSNDAYFTPGEIVTAQYQALKALGFEKGKILDPSGGTSNYFGLMPAEMEAQSTLAAIEPESMSFRIASLLYDDAAMQNSYLQDARTPHNFYDLAISNVPFSTDIKPADTRYNKFGLNLHSYFFVRALNQVRPGGIVSFVAPTGYMDGTKDEYVKARKEADKLGVLVAAIRLPSGLFSSTDVAADMIFLQRRQHGVETKGQPWINTASLQVDAGKGEITGNPQTKAVIISEYFEAHPEMILADAKLVTDRHYNEVATWTSEGRDFKQDMAAAIATIPKTFTEEAIDLTATIDDLVPAPGHVREGAFYLGEDGKLYRSESGVQHRVAEAQGKDLTAGERIRSFVRMVMHRRELLRSQLEGGSDADVKGLQKKLTREYDAFVKKFGFINKNGNIEPFIDDPDAPSIMALEHYDEELKTATKADIFSQRVLPQYVKPTSAENATDALLYSYSEKGYVDMKYMQALTGMTKTQMLHELGDSVFEDPESEGYVAADDYLSGNVRRKLAIAKDMAAHNPTFERNVTALLAVQPKDLPVARITVRLGAPWIPEADIEDYIKERMEMRRYSETKIRIDHNVSLGTWALNVVVPRSYGSSAAGAKRGFDAAKVSVLASSTWGTKDANFFKLLELGLQNKTPRITRPDPKDSAKNILDVKATEAAAAKQDEIQDDFEQWLWKDTEREHRLHRKYNDEMNNKVIHAEYDGGHMKFPGKNPFYPDPSGKTLGLYLSQPNGAWRFISDGNTYYNHEVGTGKSITLSLVAMEAKRLGLKKKPMIATLKPVVRQLAREFMQLYPTAHVLVVDIGQDPLKNKVKLAKIANNNWDAVIVSHGSMDRIHLSPEQEAIFLAEEIDEYKAMLESLRSRDGENKKDKRQSEIATKVKAMEEKKKKLLTVNEGTRHNHLYWEDLGIDLMLVDEAHIYKNVPFASNLGNIKGINPVGSPTAEVFYHKTKYMNITYKSPSGKQNGVVLASGSPVSNSVGELYTISRYLQPDVLKENGIHNFDAWAASFGNIGMDSVPNLTGAGYKMVNKFKEFVNLVGLKTIVHQKIDTVLAKDVVKLDAKGNKVTLKRPKNNIVNVIVPQSPHVEAYQKIIVARAEALQADRNHAEYDGTPDLELRIVGHGRKVAVDHRMIPEYRNEPEHPLSKIVYATANIVKHYKESAKDKGVQLIFADLGTPKSGKAFVAKSQDEMDALDPQALDIYLKESAEQNETDFSVYDGIKDRLIKQGVPSGEIAFIHDAKNEKQLAEIIKKVNEGTYRVIIGSTSKLGTGVNVQKRVIAIHNMDIWWNFSSYVQRLGRGERAGNIFSDKTTNALGVDAITTYNYVTKATIDSFMWDTVGGKGMIISSVMSPDLSMDRIADVSQDSIDAKKLAAIGSDNPLKAELVEVENVVRKLGYQKAAFEDGKRELRWKIHTNTLAIAKMKAQQADAEKDNELMEGVDAFMFKGDKRVYILKKDGKEIAAKLAEIRKDPAIKRLQVKNDTEGMFAFGTFGTAVITDGEIVDGKAEKVTEFKIGPYGGSMRVSNSDGDLALMMTGPVRSHGIRHLNITTAITGKDKDGRDVKEVAHQVVSNLPEVITRAKSANKDTIDQAIVEIPRAEEENKQAQENIDKPFPKEEEVQKNTKRMKELEEIVYSTEGASTQEEEVLYDEQEGAPFSQFNPQQTFADDIDNKDWALHRSRLGNIYTHGGVSIAHDVTEMRRNRRKQIKPGSDYGKQTREQMESVDGDQDVKEYVTPFAFKTMDGRPWLFITPSLRMRADYYELIQHAFPDAKYWLKTVPSSWRENNYLIAESGGKTVGAIEMQDTDSYDRGNVDQFYDSTQLSLATPGTALNATSLNRVRDMITNALPAGSTALAVRGTIKDISVKGALAHGVKGTNIVAAGMHQSVKDLSTGEVRSLITLALDAGQERDGYHEIEHAAEMLGLIDQRDYSTLRRAFPDKDGKKSSERRADAYADYVSGKAKPAVWVKRIFDKILNFLNQLTNALNSEGFRTADDVFADLTAGKLKEGITSGGAIESEPAYSLAAVPELTAAKEYFANNTAADMAKGLWQMMVPANATKSVTAAFPKIMDAMTWMFSTPVSLGGRDARNRAPGEIGIKDFVDTGISRAENNMSILLDFRGADMLKKGAKVKPSTLADRAKEAFTWDAADTTTEWGRIENAVRKGLDVKQQAAVDTLQAQGDINNTVYASLADAMKDARVTAAAPTQAAFDAYRKVRDYIDGPMAAARERAIIKLGKETGATEKVVANTIKAYREHLAAIKGWMPRKHGTGTHQVNVYHQIKALPFAVKTLSDEAGATSGHAAALPFFAGKEVNREIRTFARKNMLGITRNNLGAPIVVANDTQAKRIQAKITALESKLAATKIIDNAELYQSQIDSLQEKLELASRPSDVRIAEFMSASKNFLANVRAQYEADMQPLRDEMAEAKEAGAHKGDILKIKAAMDALGDGSVKVKVYMRLNESRRLAEKLKGEVAANLKGHLDHVYHAGETYQTSYKGVAPTSEDTYGDFSGGFAAEKIITEAIQKAQQTGKVANAEAAAVRNALFKGTADVLLARGAGRHQIKRADYLIQGYDKENTTQLYHDYMSGAAGMLSKALYAKAQFDNYRYAPNDIKPWAEKYMGNTLRNMGHTDRMGGNVRAIATFMFLGFKVSSVLVNSTQVWTLGVAELGRRTKQNSVKQIGKAQLDIFKGRLSADEQALFSDQIWKEQEMATAINEMSGAGEGATGKASKFLHTLVGKSLMPFQEVEMLNRKTMVLAAYRSFLADGMTRDDAIKGAMDVNRETNFEMSRANLPAFAHNPVGRTLYALQSFVWNNWNWVYKQATSGEKADIIALLKYAGMIAAIGGVTALAGGDEINKLLRRLTGKDYRLAMEIWMRRHAKDYGTAGELMNAMVWHGGAGALGVNISNAMRLNIPMPGFITGESTAGEAAMGIWSGIYDKGMNTAKYAARGQVGRALESAAPAAIEAPLKAYRMATQGATTTHGKPVFDEHGQPLKYSGLDAAKRAVGLQPSEQSFRSEVTQSNRTVTAYWSEKRGTLMDSLRVARSAEDRKGVMVDIMRYNKEVRKSQAWPVVNVITAESLRRSAAASKPNRKQQAQLARDIQ